MGDKYIFIFFCCYFLHPIFYIALIRIFWSELDLENSFSFANVMTSWAIHYGCFLALVTDWFYNIINSVLN